MSDLFVSSSRFFLRLSNFVSFGFAGILFLVWCYQSEVGYLSILKVSVVKIVSVVSWFLQGIRPV